MNNKQSAAKPLDKALIRRYTEHKHSLRGLAEHYNTGRMTIKKYLIDNHVKIDSNRRDRRYKLTDCIFNKVNTQDTAYWLGFLYADGCVIENNKVIQLNLSEKDMLHVETFRDFVGSTHPIRIQAAVESGFAGGSMCKIAFRSEKMYNDLVKLGCTPRKTNDIRIPFNKIPKGLVRHFIRGYFDGDGCVHVRKDTGKTTVCFAGNYLFLEDIKSYFSQLVDSKITPNGNSIVNFDLRYSSGIDTVLLYQLFYFKAKTFMYRKRQMFKSSISVRESLEESSETKSSHPKENSKDKI